MANYGPSVARNVGFQVADGDIITYLDLGDELSEGRIAHIVEMFTKYPKTKLLFDSYIIQYPNKKEVTFDHFVIADRLGIDFESYKNLSKLQNISIPMGVAHMRKPFVEVGGFQRGIVCGEDGILWRRMIEKLDGEEIMFTNASSGTYYISETGQSRTQRRFEQGGFAFDAKNPLGSNGQYLDKNWFETYSSKGLYEELT